ncbi:hypothetical protein GQ53DRAFT_774306 [Thozetella sp. PMI_491]|nr:hypothetical protein GQ53DRAFT_774306 [Thozetella sp. PMI_491]
MSEKSNSPKNDAPEVAEDIAALMPDRVFFLTSSSGDFSDEIRVLDVTNHVSLVDPGAITEPFAREVERVGKERSKDKSTWAYDLDRNTFSSTMRFQDAAAGGAVVAELDMPILKHYGGWTIRFPEQSKHSNHSIEMRPLGVWKKQESFVKDSVPYLWDMSKGKGGQLSAVIGEKKVPVAAFVAQHWFKNNCVLAFNSKMLDQVVVLASCIAVLNR